MWLTRCVSNGSGNVEFSFVHKDPSFLQYLKQFNTSPPRKQADSTSKHDLPALPSSLLSVRLSICLSTHIHPHTCCHTGICAVRHITCRLRLSALLSIYLSAHLVAHLVAHLLAHLYYLLHYHLPVCLSAHLPVHLPVHLSVHLPVHLSALLSAHRKLCQQTPLLQTLLRPPSWIRNLRLQVRPATSIPFFPGDSAYFLPSFHCFSLAYFLPGFPCIPPAYFFRGSIASLQPTSSGFPLLPFSLLSSGLTTFLTTCNLKKCGNYT